MSQIRVRGSLYPFRGVRYNSKLPIIRPGRLIAPPGEASTPEREALLRTRPFHSIHLFPPRLPTRAGDEIEDTERERLRNILAQWHDADALRQDAMPGFYLHSQEFTAPDGSRAVRHGLIGSLRLSDHGPLEILPHEETLSHRLNRQVALLEAVGVQALPIFLLYSDPEGVVSTTLETLVKRHQEESESFTDDTGQRHSLHHIDAASTIESIQSLIGSRSLLIADGHHRFDSLRRLWREYGHRLVPAIQEKISPGEALLSVYLTHIEDPGLFVGAIHRLLHTIHTSYDDALDGLRPYYHRHKRAFSAPRWDEVEALLRESDEGTLVLLHHDRPHFDILIPGDKSPSEGLSPLPETLADLDVTRLHRLILPRLRGEGPELGIDYAKDGRQALESVRRGEHSLGIFLKPTPAAAVWEAARRGLTLPPKATWFFPKIPAGLVSMPFKSLGSPTAAG